MPAAATQGSAAEGPAAEVLSVGPRRGDPRARRLRIAGVVVALVAVGVGAVWSWWPRPLPDLTLGQLEGVYAGMVRSDGTNELYVLDPASVRGERVTVAPPICAPLFASTVFNQLPSGAVDGVSTYWLDQRNSISLFTLRYPDRDQATQAYEDLAGTLDSCQGTQLTLSSEGAAGLVVQVPTGSAPDANQLAYTFGPEDGSRFAIHVMAYANTVTWQYRLESGTGAYAPLPAQQLIDGLLGQMRSVQELAASEGR